MSDDSQAQIDDVAEADLAEIRRRWRAFFGKPCPAHLPRHLVSSLLAYHQQVRRHRDLSNGHKRYLETVAKAACQGEVKVPDYPSKENRFKAGTIFVREHEGVVHRVVVMQDGLLWNEQNYPSLSAVAEAITGTHWNGRRFFGLAKANS